jgi:mono/diheme cytochrome c family protein
MASGETIFVARCSVCHLPPGIPDQRGAGALSDYPKLAGDTLVVGRDATTVARIILEGTESPVTTHENTTYSMPSFVALTDNEVADVATYIRNAWGNKASAVKAGDVSNLRRAVATTPGG